MVTTSASHRYTQHALETFFQRTTVAAQDRFLLVDNDATFDASSLSNYPSVELRALAQPQSFAQNANMAMREARGAALVLLNNDLIFTSGWREPLYCRNDAILSAVSNNELNYRTNHGWTLERFMDLEQYLGHEAELEVIAAVNAKQQSGLRPAMAFPFFCVSLPAPVYERIGFFDETFGPGGGEDVDYILRAHLAGIPVSYALQSFILHFQGKSTWRGAETADETSRRDETYFKAFEAKWGGELTEIFLRWSFTALNAQPALEKAAKEGQWDKIINFYCPHGVANASPSK